MEVIDEKHLCDFDMPCGYWIIAKPLCLPVREINGRVDCIRLQSFYYHGHSDFFN